jgi:hypothetical protein
MSGKIRESSGDVPRKDNDVKKIKIEDRYTGVVIYRDEGEDLRAVLVSALERGADLRGADLRGADLRGADLRGADLRRANLSGADLRRANLVEAHLRIACLGGANLSGADLVRADLRRADLRGADLRGANLVEAHLRGAHLDGADIREAYLVRADLREAHLDGADIVRARLGGARLDGARLDGAHGLPLQLARQTICPQGSITGWKKLASGDVLRLEIPAGAARVNAIGSRHCRAEYAIPLSVHSKDGEIIERGDLVSKYNDSYRYEIGKECRPDKWDPSVTEECSHGIHFFITFEEAVAYE